MPSGTCRNMPKHAEQHAEICRNMPNNMPKYFTLLSACFRREPRANFKILAQTFLVGFCKCFWVRANFKILAQMPKHTETCRNMPAPIRHVSACFPRQFGMFRHVSRANFQGVIFWPRQFFNLNSGPRQFGADNERTNEKTNERTNEGTNELTNDRASARTNDRERANERTYRPSRG